MARSSRTGGGSVFKDVKKLDFDYVPKELPHREEQINNLSSLFSPVLTGGRQTAFLTGSVGTGKTAVAKRFSEIFAKSSLNSGRRVDPIYINCRRRSGDKAVLLQVVRHFQNHFPDRGFSSSEMLDSLAKSIKKENTHVLVILDEADVLIKRGTDMIYQFSRFDEETGSSRKSISLLLISQKDILPMMDKASASTFGRTNVLKFNKYSRDELMAIVEQRIELAFNPGAVALEVGELIADIASEWGDARYAIELLLKAGMSADEKKSGEVVAEDARAAKACTNNVITKDKISDLDPQKCMVLLGCCRTLRGKAYANTGEVEKSYAIACEEYSEDARRHTQFWKYVKDLEALGFLDTKVSHGQGGTTTLIAIRDIPVKVLEEKIEERMRRYANEKERA